MTCHPFIRCSAARVWTAGGAGIANRIDMDSGLARRIRKKGSRAPKHPRAARAGGSPSPRAHQYKGMCLPAASAACVAAGAFARAFLFASIHHAKMLAAREHRGDRGSKPLVRTGDPYGMRLSEQQAETVAGLSAASACIVLCVIRMFCDPFPVLFCGPFAPHRRVLCVLRMFCDVFPP